jgi:hypothetical protein
VEDLLAEAEEDQWSIALANALAGPNPRAQLQRLMNLWLENGGERDQILPALEAFRNRLAAEGRTADEELILEIMDGFTGWCSI